MSKIIKESNQNLGSALIVDINKYNKIIIVITSLLLVGVYVLFTSEYTKLAQVKGVVSTNKGVVNISAPRSGYVESNFFNVDDNIKKNDILVNVTTKMQLSEQSGFDLDSEIINTLSKRKKNMEEQLVNNEVIHKLQTSAMKEELGFQMKQIEIQKGKIDLHLKRVNLAKERFEQMSKLFNGGSVNQDSYKVAYKIYIEADLDYRELLLQLKKTENRVLAIDYELKKSPFQLKIMYNEASQSITELERQILDASSRREYSIASPIDGVMATLPFIEGESVSAGDTIATLIPKDSLYHVVLFIEPHQIGFIQPGQKVSMRFSAFPYQHFGLQYGIVDKVSTAISRSDAYNDVLHLSTPNYKVIVKLDHQSIMVSHGAFPLREGMTLDASIKLESRTLIEWLFSPILSLRGKL